MAARSPTQQIDDIIVYLEHEQIDIPEVRQRAQDGIASTARRMATEQLGESASNTDVAAAAQQILADAADDPVRLGELLFNNEGDGGVYGCARCHTPGWSYDADEVAAQNPLVPPEIAAGGGFGPPLNNGATTPAVRHGRRAPELHRRRQPERHRVRQLRPG